jgi:hypothetical protein
MHKADSVTAIFEPIVQKTWEPRRLITLWASKVRYRIALLSAFYCVQHVRGYVTIRELRQY